MFERLYREMGERIFRFIRARVGGREEAEDLTEEVFFSVLRKLPELRTGDKAVPWLFAIARNAVADHYRARRPAAEMPADIAAPGTDEGSLARREIASWLLPGIEELASPYRETLLLTEIEGLRYDEVARRIGLSVSAVKSRVRRGREMIRRSLLACCAFHTDGGGRVYDYDPPPSCCRQST